ncbi:hypothetical protein V2J09_006041 [Rumex salicifolius]
MEWIGESTIGGMASRYNNGGRGAGNTIRNACLTMHQPWASLLVYGIKRIEGRSWPAPIRGRLWIHAASKVPDQETIKAMEEFYREIYAVNGVTDLRFPEHYPVSRLLGCVEVVGCLKCEELTSWKEVPEGVRLEGQTEYCWLCEQPQKLIIPFEMRGFQGVYNLENRIYEAAVRGLRPVDPPMPIKFALPDPQDPFSLRPGSVSSQSASSPTPKTPELSNAIAGARAAATQFKKNNVQAGSSSRVDWRPVSAGLRSNKATAAAQGQNRQIPGWFDDGSKSSRRHG